MPVSVDDLNRAKYLLDLAMPYMKNIIAVDWMEAHMREHWIAATCSLLGIEDDGKRAIKEILYDRQD